MKTPETQQETTNLNRKQRMMIRKRKAIKNKPSIHGLIIAFVVLMGIVIGMQYIKPVDIAAHDKTKENAVLTMTFVGDIMLGRNVQEEAELHGYDKYFKYASPFWQNADLSFANLESAVLLNEDEEYEQAKKSKNSIYLSANENGLTSLLDSGINVLACANNHAGDYGRVPIGELCDWLDTYSTKVTYAGIGRNLEEAANYKVINKNGISIGFISITDTFYRGFIANPEESGVFATTYRNYNKVVSDASKECDLVLVYIHFGEENETHANKEQKEYAHQLIDAGADIIIGSHPHVVQEIETYKDGIIFYSLGNFVFDQGSTFSRDTVLVQYRMNKEGEGLFELVPMRITQGIPSETANSFFRARIKRELCQGLEADSYYYNNEGHVVIQATKVNLNEEENEQQEKALY